MNLQNLKDLQLITKAKKEAQVLRLASLKNEEAKLKNVLTQIREEISNRSILRMGEFDTALMGQADTLWQTWIEQTRSGINQDIATTRVKIDAASIGLRKAIGQDEAVAQLCKREALRASKRENMNASYES